MGNFTINATNTSSETGTITPDIGFKYSSILNQINEALITISGMGTVDRELVELGTEIYIYRKGVLKFRGILDNLNTLSGGAVVFHVSGFESWLARENGAYASSPWKATASATIFTSMIGESTHLNAGTIEAGTNIDFRVSKTDSLWSATSNLTRKTSQDVSIDYTTSPKPEISILDHTGSSSSVATLNAGLEITDPRVTRAYPLGNKIIVYGKGDGANQITGTAQDATSIAAYGTITRTVVDRSIMSTSEANTLAAAELALTKDPAKIYDFDIINPDINIVIGDIVTLNAPDLDLTSENVRVVGIDRGEQRGKEYMTLQVTNPEYKQNIKKKGLVMAAINKRLQDSNTFMQGATNVWGDTQLLNANATDPLILRFYVPPQIDDEAGNTRINDVKLSYTSKDYRTFAGALTGNTGNAYTGNTYSNTSQNASVGITNANHGAADSGYNAGPYVNSGLIGDNTWRSLTTSVNTGALNYLFHGAMIMLNFFYDTAAATNQDEDVYVRIKNTTDTSYYPSSSGIKLVSNFEIEDRCTQNIGIYIHIPWNWSSKNYEIQYKIENETNWTIDAEAVFSFHGSYGHTHVNVPTGGDHTHVNVYTDTQHTNPAGSLNADYSLGETATTSTDTVIMIYNSANTLLWNSGNRGATEENDIDISSYITANDWYRIEIYPNSDALTYGTVYLKGGVDS